MKSQVKISFFKPTGFVDTHVIDTEHRGDAILKVLDMYDQSQKKCINYIEVKLIKDNS